MAYVGVVKALYDYDAQNPEDEISFKEDQILYLLEKGDDEWWKAKAKDQGGEDGPLGLIPCTYVEELPPMNQTRALYAYEKTSPEELSIEEDAVLHVFDEEDEWLLVRVEGSGSDTLGFVPKNYCEPFDAADGVAVPDAAEAEAELEAQRAEEERARAAALQRELQRKDKVETWAISEMDGKKKKKGTLGVGGGAIFFASESDKSPVKQYPITDLAHVEQAGAKVIVLTVSSAPAPLQFNTGNAKTTKEILDKLASSKQAAGEALQVQASAETEDVMSEEEVAPTPGPPVMPIPIPEPKQVRFSEPEPDSPVAPVTNGGGGGHESCMVLYDFEADGEDELSVTEGETLTVIDKENDEWWQVRNSRGKEGVVPAQYVEITAGGGGSAPPAVDGASEQRRAAEEARAAAVAAETARREEATRKEEQRRAIERAAKERADQEAADRRIAEEIEREEQAKRRQQADDARQAHEAEIARRREAARRDAPPAVSKRPPPHDVQQAARSLPSGRDKGAAPRAQENNRPKPNPQHTRTWSDRTGQFKVEAEFLGMNGNKLRLHKMNGVIIEVPIEKMSPEDAQFVKRLLSRKADRERRQNTTESDDVPLGKIGSWSQPPRRPSQQMSHETASRSGQSTRERRPTFDWFAFFLEAGCQMDDCTRYSANFERDRIDESILADLDASTMRSLGLREGDVIRVRKYIAEKYNKNTNAQVSQDEELARKLQEQENSSSPTAATSSGLFTGPGGKLANNTRRGRPERRSTLTGDSVDTTAIAAAGDQLRKMSLQPMEPTPAPKPATPPVMVAVSPPPEEKKPQAPKSGFDDDAWTIKPSAKPASPAPPRATPSPTTVTTPANPTDALLAQILSMRPASTGPPPGGAAFKELARPGPTPARAATVPAPSSYGLGAANTATPMAQLQAQQTAAPPMAAPQMISPPQPDPNAARGPLAPVPANQGLLNPMQPAMTGMFVPTHPTGVSPFGNSMAAQPTGYGFQQQQQQPSPMSPAYTGFPTYQQQAQQASFNAIANMPPPQMPQATGAGGGGGGDKFAPSNIFSAMRRTDFSKPEESNPQPSNKYDALRPLTTGYNGAPGMYPQATGMPGMQMQPTGMMGGGMGGMGMGGMGMGGMGMQQQQQPQPGMMPQMTGYPGQMGYMGQGGYGYQ